MLSELWKVPRPVELTRAAWLNLSISHIHFWDLRVALTRKALLEVLGPRLGKNGPKDMLVLPQQPVLSTQLQYIDAAKMSGTTLFGCFLCSCCNRLFLLPVCSSGNRLFSAVGTFYNCGLCYGYIPEW